MDPRAVRIVLVATMVAFLLVCVVCLVHFLDLGILPGEVGSWIEDNQWLAWTAAAIAGMSALMLMPALVVSRRPDHER
ncbi:hypothetical protein [Amycolatopsis antarctica]|uniref:hypothetical protein n=1 Tax=Amycolatopsis antarctica TaxID=1854586 RepID=UPI0013FDE87C|nr:hypothetical protein [Amycolatopsis antarctica]